MNRHNRQDGNSRRGKRNERGMALLAAVVCTVVILAVGMAITAMSTAELRASRADGDTVTLRNLAESGIERAMDQLNHDPTWRNTDTTDPAFHNAAVTARVDGADKTLGTYSVDPVREIGGDFVQITARGYYPSATAANRQSKRIRLIAYKKWGMPFSAAAFGRFGVPLANGSTDSYNSLKGSYRSQTPGHKGDIRTDSSDPNSITIYNNGMCNGHVIYGPGTDLASVKLDRTLINTGITNDPQAITAAPSTAQIPNVLVPSTAREIKEINGQDNIIENSLTIPAGVWACDGIKISGQQTVRTTGQVILYVRGDISITGNGIVNNGDIIGGVATPADLLILGTKDCKNTAISGNGYLSAAVYTPAADVSLNGAGTNGEVFGALAGKTVSFKGNGTVLHYDQALESLEGVVIGYRSRTWEEG